MELQYKAFPLTETQSEDSGRFSGYAATYDLDCYNDQIAPGAFAASIHQRQGVIPMLMNHDRGQWVGFSTNLSEDAKGLRIEGAIALNSPFGQAAYGILKLAKELNTRVGLSIGFIPHGVTLDETTKIRTLHGIELFEASFTPFPANPYAGVDGVKHRSPLAEAGGNPKPSEQAARMEQAMRALRAAIQETPWRQQ